MVVAHLVFWAIAIRAGRVVGEPGRTARRGHGLSLGTLSQGLWLCGQHGAGRGGKRLVPSEGGGSHLGAPVQEEQKTCHLQGGAFSS